MFTDLAADYASRRQDVEQQLARPDGSPPLTEADTLALPEPVRQWLRRSGAIGKPPP